MRKYTKEQLQPLAEKGLSSKEIAEILVANRKYIQKLLKIYELPRLKQGTGSIPMEKNPFWKGGRIVDKGGYVLIKMNQHPFASCNGYIREHRLVMEQKLGRYLLPSEVVHHINGTRNDNRIENLIMFQTNGKHLKEELTGKIPKWTAEGKTKIL